MVPTGLFTQIALAAVAEAKPCLEIRHAQRAVHGLYLLHEGFYFTAQLFFSAVNMAIILGNRAHAAEPAKFTTLFISIHRSCLVVTYRQIAITPRTRGVNHIVVRAVHGLQGKFVACFLAFNQKQLIAKFVPVTRYLV